MNASLRLTALGLFCATGVSLAHYFTEAKITENKTEFSKAQLYALFSPDRKITLNETDTLKNLQKNPKDSDPIFISHEIKEAEHQIGHIMKLTSYQGYNGKISLWLAVTLDGKVIAARTIQHKETPGLGDKLDLDVSDWILGFNGTSLYSHRFDVKKRGGDFDSFTGATITPRAVSLIIGEALVKYPKLVSHLTVPEVSHE